MIIFGRCGTVQWTGLPMHVWVDGIPPFVTCTRSFIHFGPHRDTRHGWEWSREDEPGHRTVLNEKGSVTA